MLIVIDGLDASGKTTQTGVLVKRLQSEGRTVHTLDFPQYNDNVFGGILKRFLSNEFSDSVSIDPKLSALLFAGDRYESKAKIVEWLKDPNAVVVLNRYTPSNIAYNRAKCKDAATKNEMEKFIAELEYSLLGLPEPDLVIVLGSSAKITQLRVPKHQRDAYENDSNYLDSVAREYIYLCDTLSYWVLIPIDHTDSIETVHEKVYDLVMINI